MIRKTTLGMVITVVTVFLFIQGYEAVFADFVWPGSNGYKIYLSPAEHNGDNVGCSGYIEDQEADNLAEILSNVVDRAY